MGHSACARIYRVAVALLNPQFSRNSSFGEAGNADASNLAHARVLGIVSSDIDGGNTGYEQANARLAAQ